MPPFALCLPAGHSSHELPSKLTFPAVHAVQDPAAPALPGRQLHTVAATIEPLHALHSSLPDSSWNSPAGQFSHLLVAIFLFCPARQFTCGTHLVSSSVSTTCPAGHPPEGIAPHLDILDLVPSCPAGIIQFVYRWHGKTSSASLKLLASFSNRVNGHGSQESCRVGTLDSTNTPYPDGHVL